MNGFGCTQCYVSQISYPTRKQLPEQKGKLVPKPAAFNQSGIGYLFGTLDRTDEDEVTLAFLGSQK